MKWHLHHDACKNIDQLYRYRDLFRSLLQIVLVYLTIQTGFAISVFFSKALINQTFSDTKKLKIVGLMRRIDDVEYW